MLLDTGKGHAFRFSPSTDDVDEEIVMSNVIGIVFVLDRLHLERFDAIERQTTKCRRRIGKDGGRKLANAGGAR